MSNRTTANRRFLYALLAFAFAVPAVTRAESPVILPGACCLPDGGCEVTADVFTCEAVGGLFDPTAADCADAACEGEPTACDALISELACPTRLIFETDGGNGMLVPLPELPQAEDCAWVLVYDPSPDVAFPVGTTSVAVVALGPDEASDSWVCEFDVVVDLVWPDMPRRRKGGGANVPDCSDTPEAALVGPATCGMCFGPAGISGLSLVAMQLRPRRRIRKAGR